MTNKRKHQTHDKSRKQTPGSPGLATVSVGKDLKQNEISKTTNPTPINKGVINEKEKKRGAFITRTIWTLAMISGFIIILGAGHLWVIALVLLVECLSFKEVINLSGRPKKTDKMPINRSLSWFFLVTTIFYLYGRNFIFYFKNIIHADKLLYSFATYHRFISFSLYIFGFVFFVRSLEKGNYKFQFKQFCITLMALLLIVCQAHLVVNNILSGLFWFLLPAALVITNDIFAYLCGITFGRTPLISISPKKTMEGFIGAWICTAIFSILLCRILINWSYVTCPVIEFSAHFLSKHHQLMCEPNPVFIPTTYSFEDYIFDIQPIYFHTLVLATFASLIAPFGGFFASGLKRTFEVKDFGDTIPGHGGITDRMDCQFIMGSFTYLYYSTFIATNQISTVGSIMSIVLSNLTPNQQAQLVEALARYLHGNGEISDDTFQCIYSKVS